MSRTMGFDVSNRWSFFFRAVLVLVLLASVWGGLGPQRAKAASSANVLLLADADTAGTQALVAAFQAAGYTVTQVTPEYSWDATNPPLAGFDAVVHINGGTYWAPLPVSAQTALLDFVVNQGGGFIEGQWNGYEDATGQQPIMDPIVLREWPNPDNCGGCTMTWTTVSGQESHQVLQGVPSSFTFNADGHDANLSDETGVQVLMTSQSGGDAVIVKEFTSGGRVIDFAVAPNYFGDLSLQDPNIQKLYVNAVKWAAGVPSLPTTAQECKKDGWQAFGVFKNQGDCVSFVSTLGKNAPAG